ncbi:hypothetical protein Syn7502_00186 [Synechococcus sp. PCC 7502]|uniref:DUF192 domain-containing protein n=1 Tax=Synechococcus sp. PCC 7502 TaxID=1173263 RepID=UPI00029FEB55|nr:DUF192 domain-containing protein [Synechococcus sp. PCC 7502]AFY72354.1 hypothetical protein Syn7502_00186 [Synechococcus sp. PCC 7502]
MTGLTFKNCDIFYRRVCIYLGSTALGLSTFLTFGCMQISAHSSFILSLTSSNVISDTLANPNNLKINSPIAQKISQTDKAQYLPIAAKAKMAGRIINLEVTRTTAEQSKGLMFRPTLPDDRGMLFNFNPPQAIGFWMKDVPVPLDMVFLYQGKVVAISANAQPCKSLPCKVYPANAVVTDQVIEIRAGLAKEIGLKLGDVVTVEGN